MSLLSNFPFSTMAVPGEALALAFAEVSTAEAVPASASAAITVPQRVFMQMSFMVFVVCWFVLLVSPCLWQAVLLLESAEPIKAVFCYDKTLGDFRSDV